MKTGKKKHPLYTTWIEMRRRCRDPRRQAYKNYGGRGIKVCERWQDFWNFVDDVGERPKGHTLDRVDNNGDYGPDNFRWADINTQASNRRTCKYLPWQGQTKTISQWSRHTGIHKDTLNQRTRLGWPVSRILTEHP